MAGLRTRATRAAITSMAVASALACDWTCTRDARADDLASAPVREPTRAKLCPLPPLATAALGGIDGEARLAFVRDGLRDQAKRARLWNTSWAIAGVGLAGGSYALAAITTDRTLRIESIVSGTPALAFPLFAIFAPLDVQKDSPSLEALVLATSSSFGKMDTCLLLARAEQLFARDADDEATRNNWFAHSLDIGTNLATGLIIGFALGDWLGATLNTIAGIAIGELNLWTQPTGAVGALGRYRAGVLTW